MDPDEFISLLEKSIHSKDLFSDKDTLKRIIEQLKYERISIALQNQDHVFWNKLIKRLATLEENSTRVLLNSFLEIYEKKEEFINFLILMDNDVVKLICKYFPIKKYIASAKAFSDMMAPLSISQRAPLYEVMARYLPAFVTDTLSLCLILKFCTELQRARVYEAVLLHLQKTIENELKIKKIHPSSISTSLLSSYSLSGFFSLQKWVPTALFDALPCDEEEKQEPNRESIWSLVQSAKDFYNLLMYLPLKYRNEIYLTMKDRLVSLIKNAKDFYFILSFLSIEQKNDFVNFAFSHDIKIADEFSQGFEVIKSSLEPFINSENDFENIFTQLNPEQCFLLGKKLRCKISSIFKQTSCFTAMSQKLSIEQFQALCESIPEELCDLVYELSDFQKLSELSYDKQYVFLKNTKPHLAEFLNKKIFYCNEGFFPLLSSLKELRKELKNYYKEVCAETFKFNNEPVNLQFFYKDQESIEIKTSSQLMACMNLDEWLYILEKTQFEYEKQLIETGSGIQYFVNFLGNLKRSPFLQNAAPSFFDFYYDLIEMDWNKFIKNSADFNSVVSELNLEEKEKFFTLVESIIPQYIHGFIDLKLIFMQLSRSQKLKVYEQIKHDLWLEADNIEEILSYFNKVLPEDYQKIQKECLMCFIQQLEIEDKKTSLLELFIKENKERLQGPLTPESILLIRQSLGHVIQDSHLGESRSLNILLKKMAIALKNPSELLVFSSDDLEPIKTPPKEPLIFKTTFCKEIECLKAVNTSEAFAVDKLNNFYFLKTLLRSFLKEEASPRGITHILINGEKICLEGEQIFLFGDDSNPIDTSLFEHEISFFPTAAYKTHLPQIRFKGLSEENFNFLIQLTHRDNIKLKNLMDIAWSRPKKETKIKELDATSSPKHLALP